MGKHTDEFTKEKIIGIYQSGKSLRSIANNVKISYSTVKDIVKKFKVTGSVKRKLGSGRKPLLSSEDRSILCQINYNNPRKNAKELKKDLEECKNVNVSTRTIIRNLAHENLFVSIAKRKPLLSAKNKVSKYELSRKFLGHSDELWKSVIFSDESTFELFATKNTR